MVGIGCQTLLHRVLGHHIVDGEVLAHVADKLQETVVLHPVVVVDQNCGIRSTAVEIKEFFELLTQAFLIVAKCSLVDKHTLLALH